MFVGINTDQEEPAALKKKFRQAGITWRQILDGSPWGKLCSLYDVDVFPGLYVVDPAGRLRARVTERELEGYLKALLAEPERRRRLAPALGALPRRAVGLVVGVVTPKERYVLGYGRFSRDDPRRPDELTLFEIGSVTKVFTALLLARLAEKATVRLEDPAAKYVPPGVTLPRRGDRRITLLELATHTSGLPRLPADLDWRNRANPYHGYSRKRLFAFLSRSRIRKNLAGRYGYSNLGMGLLGELLARAGGDTYEEVLRREVLAPLGLDRTAVKLGRADRRCLAPGHTAQGERAPNWTLGALAGAGGLRSTAGDLLRFLEAQLGRRPTPLAAAIRLTHRVRRPRPGGEVALGWHVDRREGREVFWHNGRTGGYAAFVAFVPRAGVGVVLLTNTALSPEAAGWRLVGALSRPRSRKGRQGG